MGCRKRVDLSRNELIQFLSYDQEAGTFVWAKSPVNGRLAGDIAGHRHHSGYWAIELRGKTYQAHRLAWLFIKGVCFHKLTGKWTAHIQFEKKLEHLGLFESEEEAAQCRKIRADELHGEFARSG